MIEIGRIVLLQVQCSSLKKGERPNRYYDRSPLLHVPALVLTPGGVAGLGADGARLGDVHHADHPESKNRNFENSISIGFTSHYHAMRTKFGGRVVDGCAGENIVVEAARQVSLEDLGSALRIQSGDRAIIISNVSVATPCLEFGRFVHAPGTELTGNVLRETIQFLNNGMRGFYARLADGQPDAQIRLGDRIFKAH